MYDIRQTGRSMVEMLGVLAIIGVLSVSGIYGYQKAMTKYRMNKWSSQFHELVANIQTTYFQQVNFGEAGENIYSTVKKIGAIPTGFIDDNGLDVFGNYLSIDLSTYISDDVRLDFGWSMPGGDESVEVCKEVYNIANNYNTLWYVGVNSLRDTGYCGNGAPSWYVYCANRLPVNITKTAQICKEQCKEAPCHIRMLLDNNVR